MLIDWFTVAAQALNFLILVWLLKHFLYHPILEAIEAREKRIASELADAAALKAAAKTEHDDLQGRHQAFDRERNALLSAAADEANAAREQLLVGAHRDADRLRLQQDSAMRADQLRLGLQIRQLAGQEVFAITRKALKDLAGADLEERMGEVFTRRLREMDSKTKESLASALRASSQAATLRSAFEMPSKERDTIQNALNETFSAAVRLRFETEPNAISGIELTVGGQRLSWGIAEYLTQLEQKLGSLLETQALTPTPTPPVSLVKTPAASVA